MTPPLQAGKLIFRPGRAVSTVGSNRVALAGMLLRGKPAQQAPQLLPRLYALCGEAHRLTARLAVDAAAGLRSHATPQELSALDAETAREHVRRIWLDWPRLFGGTNQNAPRYAVQALRDCPLLQQGAAQDDPVAAPRLRAWLEAEVLGEPAPGWLVRWQADPDACMRSWVARAQTLPATLLRDVESDATWIAAAAAPLLPHADRDALQALAQSIATIDDFDRAPTIAGAVCETGVWTRLATTYGRASSVSNVWLRLGARIAELVLLCNVACGHLALGAVMLAPGEALAWSEMARGLLLHWVKLAHAGASAIIADYRVVAPTEWNFHPSGVVAKALAAMPVASGALAQAQAARRIGILAAAFDPCITYEIEYSHA